MKEKKCQLFFYKLYFYVESLYNPLNYACEYIDNKTRKILY